jgi:hypothetical protein
MSLTLVLESEKYHDPSRNARYQAASMRQPELIGARLSSGESW